MAISSGGRQAAVLGGSWVLAGIILTCSVMYSAELTAVARRLTGLPGGAMVASEAAKSSLASARVSANNVELRAGDHGHYMASIEVNGSSLDVLVDTGASMVALTYEDAQRAGLSLRSGDFTQNVQTANGTARFAPVTLERVSLAHITLTQVRAAVAEPGRLSKSLLGMSFLGRLQRVDMRGGVMTLVE